MSNVGFRGVDIRQTANQLVFRALLQDTAGAIVTTGTTSLYLYEVQSDATLKSYDFNSNTFITTALTTETLAMTHRLGNNSTTNTGLWTVALATLSGFTVGGIYLARVKNTGASPTDQCREFQFGGAQGDMVVTSNALEAKTVAMSAGVITAAVIATDAVDADALAADAVAEIQSGLSTLTAAGIRTAVGLAAANLDTQLSTIAGYIDTEIATLVSNIALILARMPALSIVTGTVAMDGTNSATSFKTDLASSVDNFYKKGLLLFSTGALTNQFRKVAAYTGASKFVTMDEAFTSIPVDGTAFIFINR